MILCDTGILVAIINVRDSHHDRAIGALATVRTHLITTWPCVTEAMYLLGTHGGNSAQEKLRNSIETGWLALHVASQEHAERACMLMRIYHDTPMDFADASLVVAAESLNITRILTLDRHFYAYRINNNIPFEVIPSIDANM